MNTLGNLSPDSNDSAFNHMKSDYQYPDWYNARTHKFYKKLYKRINDLVVIMLHQIIMPRCRNIYLDHPL